MCEIVQTEPKMLNKKKLRPRQNSVTLSKWLIGDVIKVLYYILQFLGLQLKKKSVDGWVIKLIYNCFVHFQNINF